MRQECAVQTREGSPWKDDPANRSLSQVTREISLTPQEQRYAESQLPARHRFAMITTLFTNSILWVARQ